MSPRRRLAAVAPLLALLAAAATACAPGTSGDPAPTAPASSAPASTAPAASGSASAPAGARVIAIRLLADGSVEPNGERIEVAVGEPITLEVTSERDDEVHVHGIDEEIDVDAGETESETVTFDTPGSYEVESHEPARIILIVNVR